MSNDSARNTRKKSEMCVYAGKVHVRGLLRRVWRPRYLALDDNGYLRYHESIPPLVEQQDVQRKSKAHSSQNSYSNMYNVRHTHRPKSILAILDGARTINTNSMVDRHVALPEGVHGFVFRGRPVEMHTTGSNNIERGVHTDGDQGALIVPAERNTSLDVHDHKKSESAKLAKKSAVVNLVFPKGTARRKTVQKIAKKAINPDVLCAFSLNNCVGGASSPSLLVEESGNGDYEEEGLSNNEWGGDSHESQNTIGSFQPVDRSQISGDFNDNVRHHPPSQQKAKSQDAPKAKVQVQASSIQSREYLCAVSTPEEAESWVVALRWAAEHRRGVGYENSIKRTEESVDSSSISVSTFPNTADELVRNMVGNEPINPMVDQAVGRISRNIKDIEVHKGKNSSKRNSTSSGGESSTQRDSGDSRASLNSLLVEPDGWCNTEKGKKTKATDINVETWVKALPQPSLFPEESGTDSEADADTQGLSSEGSGADADADSQELPMNKYTTLRVQLESSPVPSTPKQQPVSPGGATIVVTKVSKFYLPPQSALAGPGDEGNKNIAWLPFHFPLPGDELVLHYEIQLLLLKNCKPRTGTLVQPESVEERTIFKSIHDVLALVRGLITEFDAAEHEGLSHGGREHDQSTSPQKGGPTLLQSDGTSLSLEDIESKLLSCLDFSKERRTSVLATVRPSTSVTIKGSITELSSDALASVSIIDNAMRKLSNDKNICSSRHFQDFLCLRSMHRHRSSSLATTITFSEKTDAEQVVKKWLSQIDHPSTMSKLQLILAICLRHDIGGPIMSLVVIWSTTHLASMIWLMIAGTKIIISIPLETYAALLALSFFIGNNYGVSSRSRHEKHNLVKQSRKGRHTLPPVSLDKSNSDKFSEEVMPAGDDDHSTVVEEEGSESESESDEGTLTVESSTVSSPLPLYPANAGITCWSKPDHNIFMVRSASYFKDRIKTPSAPAVFQCRGVDVWITDNAERNIARHPSVLGGNLEKEDTFVVNFLLPFANFVAYFTVPPIEEMPANIANVWKKFVKGDQQYRDGKLKLLPVVVDGPWIVKKAVGPGTSPAMVGRDLPLQYYFTEPTATEKGVYEVDVLVTASRIARGILNVVKGHTKSLTIAFAFIIEASEQAQLPETVLCAFQVHSLHLEDCPNLPDCYPDG